MRDMTGRAGMEYIIYGDAQDIGMSRDGMCGRRAGMRRIEYAKTCGVRQDTPGCAGCGERNVRRRAGVQRDLPLGQRPLYFGYTLFSNSSELLYKTITLKSYYVSAEGKKKKFGFPDAEFFS